MASRWNIKKHLTCAIEALQYVGIVFVCLCSAGLLKLFEKKGK